MHRLCRFCSHASHLSAARMCMMISMATWALEAEIWAGKSRLLSLLLLSSKCNAGGYMCYILVWKVLAWSKAQPICFNSPKPLSTPHMDQQSPAWWGVQEHFLGLGAGMTIPCRGGWCYTDRIWGEIWGPFSCSVHVICWLGASHREMQVISSSVFTGYPEGTET